MTDRAEAAAEFIWDFIHGNWGTYEDVQEMAQGLAGAGLLASPEPADFFDRLGRQQLDEVIVALGPLYNNERHSWNAGTLARKAAADLADGTRTDFDSATVGALARLVLTMDENRQKREALQARIDAALTEISQWWGTAQRGDRVLMAVKSLLCGEVPVATHHQPWRLS